MEFKQTTFVNKFIKKTYYGKIKKELKLKF